MDDDAVVIDLVYGARPTPLVGTTRARQQVTIDGRDVLVAQVRHLQTNQPRNYQSDK